LCAWQLFVHQHPGVQQADEEWKLEQKKLEVIFPLFFGDDHLLFLLSANVCQHVRASYHLFYAGHLRIR
jgi:hypothetical protein